MGTSSEARAYVSTQQHLGRYTLLEKISSGGMGDVFLAVSPGPSGASGLFKFVAIKKIHPEFMSRPETRSFFETEGKISLQLSHGNLVQMYEASSSNDDFFFVIEYINGITLRRLIKNIAESEKCLPNALLLQMLVEFANGLEYIHSYTNPAFNIHSGIVHQDISSNNVMVDFNGRVKIIDFGIAMPQVDNEKNNLVVGQMGYMSPEQYERQPVTNRSDIFSFGVTMWELICGRRLFVGPDVETIVKKKMNEPVPMLNQFNTQAPRGLQAIVTRCLQLAPQNRYASVSEILTDLFQIVKEEDITFQNGAMAEFLGREFSQEKQANLQRLKKYSQDIINKRLKISPVAQGLERRLNAKPTFTELIPAGIAGAEQKKKIVLILDKICSFAQVADLTNDEILVEGQIPAPFWGQQCLLVHKDPETLKSASTWVNVSANGERILR